MFGKKNVETLIAGAGPTGMLAALVLAEYGVDACIVDSAPKACTTSNAVTIHPQTLKLFDRLGFAERVIDSGYRVEKVLIYDGIQPRETVRLSELPIAYPYAVSIAQSELEYILEDELNAAGLRILWNHRVSDIFHDGPQLDVEVDRYSERGMGYAVSHTERVIEKTLHYQAGLLIAADGYNSLIRRIEKAEVQPFGDNQYFVFFEFETDADPQHAVRLNIKDNLATAQYPLSGGLSRLSFQFEGLTLPNENRNKERDLYQNQKSVPELLNDQHFNDLVRQRVPWTIGYINRFHYRAAVPFEKSYLPSPYKNGVFFLGDAARSFGPLGSLGLNLGLMEAEKIAHCYKTVLSEKVAERKPFDLVAEKMVLQWKMLEQIENHSAPVELADPWIAANRARILRSLPATGETLERIASQLFLHLKVHDLVEV